MLTVATNQSELVAGGLVFFGTLGLLYYFMNHRRLYGQKKRHPPSLMSLPIVGSLPFLPSADELHIFFMNRTKKLGNVYSVYLGNKRAIIINGPEEIREALVKHSSDYADRPKIYVSEVFNPKQCGIVEHNFNADFKKFHQLSLTIFKEFGYGQGIMETRITAEVDELVRMFKEVDGNEIDPNLFITRCVFNVISSIIFGQRFEMSDPKFKELVSHADEFIRNTLIVIATDFLPLVRFLPKYKQAFQDFNEALSGMLKRLEEMIQICLSEKSSDNFVRSYVEHEGPGYDHEQLLFTIRDLFIGGAETTTSTMRYMLVLVANHPRVQQQIYEEISRIVSTNKYPAMEDKGKLPYVEATVLEVMRIKTLVPLSFPHSTICDTEVGGYFIPAKSRVMINLYSVHMSRDVWSDPEVFQPERFLDPDGKVFKKDLVIPFSLGKRSCLGENIARQELFLFTSALIQQFHILPPEGQDVIDFRDIIGITAAPSPYKVRLIKRQ